MAIRIGVAPGGWQWTDGATGYYRFVEALEEYGWDSLWLSDRLVSDRMSLEPVVALAAAAGRTTKLKFGFSVLALPLRNPAVLAKELATLDFLANGRLLPAVGLGGDDEREYEATGTRKPERAGRTDEAIAVLRRLWTEQHVTHEGRYYRLTDVTITPKPVFQPHPPIWIGGRSAPAWERVGRLGDGWLVSQATPAEVAEGIAAIRTSAAKHGRVVEDDHYGVMLPVYLAATRDEAAAKAVFAVPARQRADAPLDQFAALGNADDVLAKVAEYVAAGATKFVLRPLCREPEALDQLRLIGREVIAVANTVIEAPY